MCGIAGYLGDKKLDEARVRNCLDLMGRRGPDHQDFFRTQTPTGKELLLLHSRLSIIDLDQRSVQPFVHRRNVLTYNGELYNYVELREKLRNKGSQFKTESDTEVLAEILHLHKISGLDECEGMWAFAFYNQDSGSLLLGRDRFGEKPLYYYEDETGTYFGSEPKFIFSLLGRKPPIDQSHLRRYLVNGYKALYKNGQTFFEGLKEVAAGTTLEIQARGEPKITRYWNSSYEPDASLTYSDCVVLARDALVKSMGLRLRADVPLAFCMSGGIDSNALISIAKKEFNYDVQGFTIANTDQRYDEMDLVKESVAELGIKHTVVPVTTDDFLTRLRKLVVAHDAPVYTINYYAQWLLMEKIQEAGYRISVSGTGADEIFSGYYDHHPAYFHDVSGTPKRYEEAVREWEKFVKPVVRNPLLNNPKLFLDNPDCRDHIYFDRDVFSGFLKDSWSEDFTETNYTEKSLLINRMRNEIFHEIVPPILHEDDLNAMYFSIENRSPFLDRNLFELVAQFPVQHFLKGGYAKSILRDAVRGIAPNAVLDKHQKVGFNAPIFSFLDRDNPKVKDELLKDSPIFDVVERTAISSLLESDTLPNSKSKFVFYFLNAKLFLEEFSS